MRLIVKTMITKELSLKLGKLWSRGCTLLAACVILWETRCVMYEETCGSRFRDGSVRLHDDHNAEKRCVTDVHNRVALEQISNQHAMETLTAKAAVENKWRT